MPIKSSSNPNNGGSSGIPNLNLYNGRQTCGSRRTAPWSKASSRETCAARRIDRLRGWALVLGLALSLRADSHHTSRQISVSSPEGRHRRRTAEAEAAKNSGELSWMVGIASWGCHRRRYCGGGGGPTRDHSPGRHRQPYTGGGGGQYEQHFVRQYS